MKYDDIINLPHHVSKKHTPMPISDRAAQFSPFAALTGYEDAIAETARQTTEKSPLSEAEEELLNRKLNFLKEHITEHPEIEITYFEADRTKAGGAYLTKTGNLKKIDEYKREITLQKEEPISFDNIFDIDGEIFKLKFLQNESLNFNALSEDEFNKIIEKGIKDYEGGNVVSAEDVKCKMKIKYGI